MPDKVSWKRPVEMCEADRQESAKSLRTTLWKCIAAYLILGVPISIYISTAVNRPLLPLLCAMALVFTYLPLMLMVTSWAKRKQRTAYEISAEGILNHKGGYYKWRNLEGYNFSDSGTFPGVRVLNLKIRYLDYWRELPYCTNDVDERDLLEVLQRFAPESIERSDNQSTPAELEKVRLSCVRPLYVFGILSGALGIGSAISIVDLCNINSHSIFVSLSYYIILLFVLSAAGLFAVSQRYKRTIKQIASNKDNIAGR